MKNFAFIVFSLFLVTASGLSFADETINEKAAAGANGAKRVAKKGAHRVSEALCTKGDVKCAGEKVENRAEEVKDSVVDGSKKLKNKID